MDLIQIWPKKYIGTFKIQIKLEMGSKKNLYRQTDWEVVAYVFWS